MEGCLTLSALGGWLWREAGWVWASSLRLRGSRCMYYNKAIFSLVFHTFSPIDLPFKGGLWGSWAHILSALRPGGGWTDT